MSQTFEKKVAEIKKIFTSLTPAERYDKLIEMGRQLTYPDELKTPDRIVSGCQSTLYLTASLKDNRLHFQATADALISAGLAALLLFVYSDETPETILTSHPTFLPSLSLSLTPHRSNGLSHIYQRILKYALNALTPN